MHIFNDKVPMKEWAGVLESIARQLGSLKGGAISSALKVVSFIAL
jgi:hypothetical protein